MIVYIIIESTTENIVFKIIEFQLISHNQHINMIPTHPINDVVKFLKKF